LHLLHCFRLLLWLGGNLSDNLLDDSLSYLFTEIFLICLGQCLNFSRLWFAVNWRRLLGNWRGEKWLALALTNFGQNGV
jgi:hypothetical protein